MREKCRYINETRLYLAFLGMAWVQIECYLAFSYLLAIWRWIFKSPTLCLLESSWSPPVLKDINPSRRRFLHGFASKADPFTPLFLFFFLNEVPSTYSSVWTNNLIKHPPSVMCSTIPAPDMNVPWKYQEALWDHAAYTIWLIFVFENYEASHYWR